MKTVLQNAVGLVVGIVVSGCVMGGGERWLTAQKEDVNVQGVNYRVSWISAGDRLYDFRTHRNDFGSVIIFMPDSALEKANNIQAATIVARKLCQSEKLNQELDTKSGDMFLFRFRCA